MVTGTAEMSEAAPFRAGLFRRTERGEVVLLAGRCKDCGKIDYPRPLLCAGCGGSRFEAIEIGPEAELFAFSRVHMPTPGFKPPYTVGYGAVEGVRVFAPIVHGDAEPLAVGMALRLRPHMLDKGEGSVMAYAFHPVARDAS